MENDELMDGRNSTRSARFFTEEDTAVHYGLYSRVKLRFTRWDINWIYSCDPTVN